MISVNSSYKKSLIFMTGVLSILVLPITEASIYKCVNLKNEFFYNDKPCPALDKETLLTTVKDPLDGYPPQNYASPKKENKLEVTLDSKERENHQRSSDRVEDSEVENHNNKNANNDNKPPVFIKSSSGRKSVLLSKKYSSSSKHTKKYIMKVEENFQEPL